MSVITRRIFAITLCFFFFSPLYGVDSVSKIVRVGIILSARSFTVSCNDEFYLTNTAGRKFRLSKGTVKIASDGDSSVMLGDYKVSLPIKIESPKGMLFADGKAYRGYLTVIKAAKKINVVNILDIEDYIKGVVPKEVDSSSWPEEALKVQAVISRTYTIGNPNRHSSQGFDICATTHCQVYGGASAEFPASDEAVDATAGEILTYNGKLAQTYFHANCGGHTEDPKYIWGWTGETPPYLRGVKCDYKSGIGYSIWERTLSESFIREKLSDYKIGKIKSIKIKGKTPAGSAKKIRITHSKGALIMNAYNFRLAVDAQGIRSISFSSIKKDGDKFVFKGKGWGHGVGLCQMGAMEMAKKGKKYRKILQHYYPKTKIEKVSYK